MSRGDVELVRAFFAAFGRRDFDAAAKLLHPEVEVRPALVGGLEGTVYRGVSGNRQFWADVDATWATFRIEPQQFRDLGGRVLVLGRAIARARGSGIVLDEASAWIAELRGGAIVRFQSFTSQTDALDAAGLSE